MTAPAPSIELTVAQDFAGYRRGDALTDPVAIAEILASEQSVRVIKVPAGTHPKPEAVEANPAEDVPAPDEPEVTRPAASKKRA